jgi:hypothetical protein
MSLAGCLLWITPMKHTKRDRAAKLRSLDARSLANVSGGDSAKSSANTSADTVSGQGWTCAMHDGAWALCFGLPDYVGNHR